MTVQSADREWFQATLEQNDQHSAVTGLTSLDDVHRLAREAIQVMPLPSRQQEGWRYTDLKGLYAQTYLHQTTPITALLQQDIGDWVYPVSQSYRLVFVNGQIAPQLCELENLPVTIKIGSLRQILSSESDLIQQWITRQAGYPEDIFSALNRALFHDGLFIHVPADTAVDRPVEVMHVNIGFETKPLAQPNSLIVLGQGAKLSLLEHFVSSGETGNFFNGMNSIYLGHGASMRHYCLQDESDGTKHLHRIAVYQDAESDYRALHGATGGAWARTDIDVNLQGERAECTLLGVSTTGHQQYNDYHLNVYHTKPGCRSRESFRGIAYGAGRVVFDGRVVVDKDAQHSDAMLSNKNLLLCENAEIDTKPQLEIYADDVKCGHGTTVGRLDPQQLFYLRSRGIPEQMAQRILCMGFVEQILADIEDKSLHDFIRNKITQRLQQSRDKK